MLRRAAPLGLLFALTLTLIAPPRVASAAPETTTAADCTEPGRRIDRALDIVLDASARLEPGSGGRRVLTILLDATPSLRAAGFADRLEAALGRQSKALAATEFEVLRVGAKEPKESVILPLSNDVPALLAVVREALRAPKNEPRNVYESLRLCAQRLGGKSSAREALLVSLENGDAEDDLEDTVRALRHARVRAFVIAHEAYLADTFWASHASTLPPKGATWTGGDCAFAEVPWGWVLQNHSGNEEASSGFGPYGLSRVAAATEGRVFLHAEPSSGHKCTNTGFCPFCTGDHVPVGEAYQTARLKTLAPLAVARDDVYAAAAKDPAFKATLAAWKAAAEAGLVRSRPPVELAGSTLKPTGKSTGSWAILTGNGLSFSAYASRASKALEACERIRAELEGDIGKLKDTGEDACSPRWRAGAEFTRWMLLVTRANLIEYIGWCREAGPVAVGKVDKPDKAGKERETQIVPPERRMVDDSTQFVGVSFTETPLCHGPRPFRELHLPGGPALRSAFEDLESVWGAYMARYAGTPFGVAARRTSIAHFMPTVRGKVLPLPPRSKTDTEPDSAATTPDRPSREGGGGTATGPTSGG